MLRVGESNPGTASFRSHAKAMEPLLLPAKRPATKIVPSAILSLFFWMAALAQLILCSYRIIA